jgi:hypothetical protein
VPDYFWSHFPSTAQNNTDLLTRTSPLSTSQSMTILILTRMILSLDQSHMASDPPVHAILRCVIRQTSTALNKPTSVAKQLETATLPTFLTRVYQIYFHIYSQGSAIWELSARNLSDFRATGSNCVIDPFVHTRRVRGRSRRCKSIMLIRVQFSGK